MQPSDRAVHSDFLVHWTGDSPGRSDIEKRTWWEIPKSETTDAEDEAYIQRLRNILRYGLWMTTEGEDHVVNVGGKSVTIPRHPRCCFTELRLSESRRHAMKYGRLGIGFKRPFLIERLGRPLAYYGFGDQTSDPLLEACAEDLADKALLNFFKPMNTSSKKLVYDLYGESEWRVVHFERLLHTDPPLIINPRDRRNEAHHAYFKSLSEAEQQKLHFLLPLNGWFATIIYPSLTVKNLAQWDRGEGGVFDLITNIKTRPGDHGNTVEGLQRKGPGNWPIEVDLDACANF